MTASSKARLKLLTQLSHEQILALGLSLLVITLLSLVAGITYQLEWDWLSIATLLFLLFYPLAWLAWWCHRFWSQSLMQLSVYSQLLQDGEQSMHFKPQHRDNLLLALQQGITDLAQARLHSDQHQQTLAHILGNILESWPVPVCLFDHQLRLTYRNSAMNEQLQRPMLVNTLAQDLGFKLENGQISHPQFSQNWQCQSISYLQQEEQHWLFSAINVSQLLTQQKAMTQENLVRVLGHELRNSLTPMASMTDTLLSQQALEPEQTRLVLSRIKERSNRLLAFIGEYGRLSQLPSPTLSWFAFSPVLNEAIAMQATNSASIEFKGEDRCFGDKDQVIQLLINLIKNAIEASSDTPRVRIRLLHNQQMQTIEVRDFGSGFANLNNAVTPFYTTKKQGSGIGLALCAEIARNHKGELKVTNHAELGAVVTLSWPC